jgi:1,4-dihydroxy-2-naphthoate octaprenyltransferase
MANHSEAREAHPRGRRWLNALVLMRIPFSIFLMPVFWFALVPVEVNASCATLAFLAIHLFLYPASNGYNSWFDRDEKSIGGIKSPPQVTRELWYLILLFDFFSLLLATAVNLFFALMIFVYLLMSKAYSWNRVRLKKYPVIGALTVIFFQGFWIFLAVQAGAGESEIFHAQNLLMGAVSSLFLLGSYPMTQIYQHEEDQKRGDHSLSHLLGIRGTFVFAATVFFLASALLVFLFVSEAQFQNVLIYFAALVPVNIYFFSWYRDYSKGKAVITYEKAMRLNQLSSLLLSAAFIAMKIFGE